jgi:hypothetical protein
MNEDAWRRWAGPAAAAVSAVLGVAVGIGSRAGQHHLAGLPGVAAPGAVVLLTGAVLALAGGRRPHRLVTGAMWTVAGLCLAGSCWLLLDLCQLALQGTVTDRAGHSGWLAFGERLALTVTGALFVAAALARRPIGGTVAVRPAEPRPASRRVRWIAYAGCLAWLPYAGLHTLAVLGVPGIEPGEFERRADAAVVLWIAVGLAVFLLLGLVCGWGQVFPRWAPPLTGRRVPRFLPIVPVWLIAPTFVLYGLGSGVFAVLLQSGVVTWHGGDDVGLIGFAQPISFAGYGLAVAIAAVSYQLRTRPVRTAVAP